MVIVVSDLKKVGKWLIALSLVTVMLCGSLTVFAEEPTYNTQNNLVSDNADYWTMNTMYMDYFNRAEDGTFEVDWEEGSEWGGLIEVPYLTRDFTLSGEVTIVEGKAQVWNGPRFIVGHQNETHYNIVNFCWDGSVEVSSRDPEAGWVTHKKEAVGIALAAGTTFTFKIDRNDQHITVVLNDSVVMELDIPEEYDYLDETMDNNIGMYSSDTTFTVKNFAVYDDNAVLPTPTPAPTPTPEPTEAPATPTKAPATKAPAPSDATEEEDDGGNAWLVPAIVAAAVVVVAVVVVVVVKKKKA